MKAARSSLLAALLLLAGCRERTLDVRQSADDAASGGNGAGGFLPSTGGNSGSGGSGTPGDGSAEARPACVAPHSETCNGLDDDCDGVIDDGFDLASDPTNCGHCGTSCTFGHGVPACKNGQCVLASCLNGYADADKKPENGCECLYTNDRKEICDGADNNCDGKVDEGFDFKNDLTNCGMCGRRCQFAQAVATCSDGACKMGGCNAGFNDRNKDPADGCEFACTKSNGGVEICDGRDNDCDGMVDNNLTDTGQSCGGKPGGVGECRPGAIGCVNGALACVGSGTPGPEICDGKDNDCNGMVDETDPFVGRPCYPVGRPGCDASAGTCIAPCHLGTWSCTTGKLSCDGAVVPVRETCDDLDNDCDGVVDNGYNKASDARFCGSCGNKCEFPHAFPTCQNGACVRGPCDAGWVDADGVAANGCEYQCSPEGPEVCDGKDNDCDGKIDGADPDLQFPTVNFCLQAGECGKGPGGGAHYPGAASYPVCAKPPGASRPDWLCNYPASVETSSPGVIVPQETLCDGLDNDCDGVADEHTTKPVGSACEEGIGFGECKRKGVSRCQADPTKDAACDFAGAPPKLPTHEICDGLDNDCDGLVDESWDTPDLPGLAKCDGERCRGVRDAVGQVGGLYIYQFEASRIDATAAAQGSHSERACSRPGVMPWSLVNYEGARAACAKAGMRLCSATEWTNACRGTQGCPPAYFPYGCGFDVNRCNGAEKALNATVPAGSLAMCTTTGATLYDMSGNLAEWTSEQHGTIGTKRIFVLRGGSFNNYEPALRCDSTLLAFGEDYSFPDAGFRCCSGCPPGQADCGGACVDIGTSNANCGACGVPCPLNVVCVNGKCPQ